MNTKKQNAGGRPRKQPATKKRVSNRRRNINVRRRRRRIRNRLPMAYANAFQRRFQMKNQSGTSVRVAGKDLIYQIPETINTNTTTILTVIPSNPAYWLGTRIAALAAGYQNFRPIKFKAHYIPQCAVTQQGNVLAGTLWAMSPSKENLQQTLRTSNGGMLTQCYKPSVSNVKLGVNLQYNLYRMGGKFDQESNPFTFVALAIAVTSGNNKINPGYFSIEYEYEFKNPIGNTIQYFNSGLIQKQNYVKAYQNESCINCSATTANIGATLQLDDNKYYYNDNEIVVQDTDELWYFSNDLIPQATKSTQQQKLNYIEKIQNTGSFEIFPDTGYQWLVVTDTGGYTMYFVYNTSEDDLTFSLNNQKDPLTYYDVYVMAIKDFDDPTIIPNFILTNAYTTGSYSYKQWVFNYQTQLQLVKANKETNQQQKHYKYMKDVLYEDQKYQRISKPNFESELNEEDVQDDEEDQKVQTESEYEEDEVDNIQEPLEENINAIKAKNPPKPKMYIQPFGKL